MWLFNQTYGLMVHLHPFLMGTTFALSIVAAVIFLRFYGRTSDRLFLFFSAAFAVLALNRIAFQAIDVSNEAQPLLYLVRLVAFVLILVGIIDKNRRGRRAGR